MVEKMGHKKRMQSMRMEWINEGKPHSSVHEDSLFDDPAVPARENAEREKTASRVAPIFEKRATERPRTPVANEDADMFDDLYDVTPRAARQPAANALTSVFGGDNAASGNDDVPPEDDIDALLAEEEMWRAEAAKKHTAPPTKIVAQQDDFEDDLDALMAEQEMLPSKPIQKAPAQTVQEDDFEDDLDALLAEEESIQVEKENQKPIQVSKLVVSQADGFDDDMDALMEMGM